MTESEAPTSSTENTSSSYDGLFKDRYTMENETYKKISEGFEKVVIVHPFYPRQQRDFKRDFNNRGRGDGGGYYRGGRGGGGYSNNYNNRGGGNYSNNRGSWRGGNNGGQWRGGGGGGGFSDRKRNYDHNGQ